MDRPLLAILVSLLAAVLIRLIGDRPAAREACTFVAAVVKFALVASMIPIVLGGGTVESAPIGLVPGLTLHLRVDALGLLFALVASALWIVTSIYSVGYMRAGNYQNQTGYFASFAVCLSATIGIAFAGNLPTFFVFYEILTLATYPLVVHDRTDAAIAGGRTYLVYTLIAGQALLIATVWASTLAPGEGFRPGGFLPADAGAGVLLPLFALFIVGVGVKAAVMPLHGWLPAAMVAPTPVSALLHAVAVVKAGVFGVLRVVGYVFGVDLLRTMGAADMLAVVAAVTILVASLRALSETNLKRRLAYSTIGQLSYIVLGAAIGSVAALAGAMFYIAAHAFMKITLFFAAGALHIEKHRDKVTELAGLAREMPVTMTAFAIAASGLAGIPLFVGFVGKWYLGLGAIEAGRTIFVFVLVTSGLLNLAYFYPIVYDAFFGNREAPAGREARWTMSLPLAITALASVAFGLAPDLGFAFFTLAWQAAESVVTGGGGGP
jgi:multicomponent Na+:H+ antiporter subunit D